MQSSIPRTVRCDAAMALVILGLGCFLASAGADLLDRWQRSASRRQSIAFEDLLGLVAIVAGLVIVAWWVLSLMAAFAAALFERTGRKRAAAVSGRFSPAFMRRLALAAVGVQLIGAPLAHADAPPDASLSTSTAAVSAAWAPTAGQSGSSPIPAPVRQADPRPSTPDAVGAGRSAPGAGQSGPGAGQSVRDTSDIQPQWQPRPPVTAPRLVTSTPVRAALELPGTAQREVAVRAGDSLWTIAARELGPEASDVEIAMEWPRWFEANMAAIGNNPDVLLPGQILRAP
jgi:nucleoid-associated protein YgaU